MLVVEGLGFRVCKFHLSLARRLWSHDLESHEWIKRHAWSVLGLRRGLFSEPSFRAAIPTLQALPSSPARATRGYPARMVAEPL